MHHVEIDGAIPPETVEVMTVLLIGFDGRRKVLTGVRDVLWNEFLHGDGGPGCNGVQPVGWQYWVPQALGTLAPDATIPGDLKIWEINK
jgi:hypothetical protein